MRRFYEIYAVVRINVVGELLVAIRIHVPTLSVLGFLDEVSNALCGDHFNPSVPPSDSQFQRLKFCRILVKFCIAVFLPIVAGQARLSDGHTLRNNMLVCLIVLILYTFLDRLE